MRCVRCAGLMTPESYQDREFDVLKETDAWRCVNCGELVDAVIVRHRTERLTYRPTGLVHKATNAA